MEAMTPITAAAYTRLGPGKKWKDEVNTVGIMEAPSRPCSARKAIMLSMFQARPHSMLASVKPAAEAVNSQRVENTRVSQPDSGITKISAIR